MFLATVDDDLMEATESGPRRATCPGCDSEVLAKTGDVVSWHWAHLDRTDCDPWSEGMTDWHRDWQRKAKDVGARLEVWMADPQRQVRHRADIVLPNGVVMEVQHSKLPATAIREREDFYARNGGLRWLFDRSSLRWLDDPRDRSRGAYGEHVPDWVLDHFGGSMGGVWGQFGPLPTMLQAVGAHMAWDLPAGELGGSQNARWVTRPIRVPAWGEWAVKVEDAPDIFDNEDRALREVDGLVIPDPVPVELPCPACGRHHDPEHGRFDRKAREWTVCWEMSEAAWALLRDKGGTSRSKDWARGTLHLEDRYASTPAGAQS